jgi:uncharacterized protein (TIGR02284 family)
MEAKDQKTSEILNRLLRGEMSAVETYRQALEKVGDEPGALQLNSLYRDHTEAVSLLEEQIRSVGGEPSRGTGPWGTWAKTVQGVAKLFGDTATLKALKEGEEHGLKDYREAVRETTLPSQVKTLIQNRLLAKQEQHVAVIDRLIEEE